VAAAHAAQPPGGVVLQRLVIGLAQAPQRFGFADRFAGCQNRGLGAAASGGTIRQAGHGRHDARPRDGQDNPDVATAATTPQPQPAWLTETDTDTATEPSPQRMRPKAAEAGNDGLDWGGQLWLAASREGDCFDLTIACQNWGFSQMIKLGSCSHLR
jgi:hypothetical protein